MVLGVVGRGWGNTYCRTLDELGIAYWQAGRDWKEKPRPDGLIVASSTDSHFEVAREALKLGLPVLIEKPACRTSMEVQELLALGGIVFVSHTRLYDPVWRQFARAMRLNAQSVEAWAGGVSPSNPDAELNWRTHLVAMCWDLNIDPDEAVFHITEERQPLRFVVKTKERLHEYRDGPALANLITEFCAAIRYGVQDNFDLFIALSVARHLESR